MKPHKANYTTVDYKIGKHTLPQDNEFSDKHRQLPFYKAITKLFLIGLLLSVIGNIYLGINNGKLKRDFKEQLDNLKGLSESGVIKLNEVQDKFIGKEVVIQGFVTFVYPLSFSGGGGYQVIDGTGVIWVLNAVEIPSIYSPVKIKGKVEKIDGISTGENEKGLCLLQLDFKYLK